MLVEITKKEIDLLRKILKESNNEVNKGFALLRHIRKGSYEVLRVVDIKQDNKGNKIYEVEYPELETKWVYKPGTGLSYGAGAGKSYQVVWAYEYVTHAGAAITKTDTFKADKNYLWKKNKQTGRFNLMNHCELVPYDSSKDICLRSIEITDPERIEQLFEEHPEWEKEDSEMFY